MLTLANGTRVQIRPVPGVGYSIAWRTPTMPACAFWYARTHGDALASVVDLAPDPPGGEPYHVTAARARDTRRLAIPGSDASVNGQPIIIHKTSMQLPDMPTDQMRAYTLLTQGRRDDA